MARHYFPRFLTDPGEYERAVDYWIDLWGRLDPPARCFNDWSQPWLTVTFADGTPMRDGNPIFSAHSPRLRKGLRVIQHEPTSHDLEFQFWLDTFGGDITAPDAVYELVVACALSDEAAAQAVRLMHDWVIGQPVNAINPGTTAYYGSVEVPWIQTA